MEEKVLVKGIFKSKLMSALTTILYILAPIILVVFIAIDIEQYMDGAMIVTGVLLAGLFVLGAIIIRKIFKKREVIVTNKRVIVKGILKFRKDFPIEKITEVSTCWFNGIGCASPSSKFKYHFCANKMEIFDTIAEETLQRDSKYQ